MNQLHEATCFALLALVAEIKGGGVGGGKKCRGHNNVTKSPRLPVTKVVQVA